MKRSPAFKPRAILRSVVRKRSPAERPTPSSNKSSVFAQPSFGPHTSQDTTRSSLLSRFRARCAALPASVRETARLIRILAPIVPIAFFCTEHVVQIMWVRGPSMTPYLNENYTETHTQRDVVLVNLWPWGPTWPWNTTKRLERGMVVTFKSPNNPSTIAIKRVIALPGDRVTTREPCPKPSQIVPFNHVWLEGDADDSNQTMDSNTYGPVSINLITGTVKAVIHPRMRWLSWQDWETPAESQTGSDAQKELGEGFRSSARDRVIKGAVKLEAPPLD